MPTHNERPNLEVLVPALLELLADEALELIVVDDASSDGSPAWLAEYAERDPRVRPVIGDALLGIGDALRRGYDAARGEILLSMGAVPATRMEKMRGGIPSSTAAMSVPIG